MNKNKAIMALFIVGLFIGLSATTASAGEIKSGRIHVTINNDVYGSTSPDIEIPEETNVTFNTIKVTDSGDDYYRVDDNLTIPLDVTCLKEKVYIRKMLRGGLVIAYRNIRDIPIVGTFSACVHKGELIGSDINVSDEINVKVDYKLTEEQFNSGEGMTMYVIALGTPFPGETEPFHWTVDLDDMLGDGLIGKIIKEFTDVRFTVELNPLVLAIKQVDLNVNYVIGGHEIEPGFYSINATIADGNGTIKKDPDAKEYEEGTVVNLTAIPEPGFLFDYWQIKYYDDNDNPYYIISHNNPISITMDENKSIQAHFKKAPVLIQVAKAFNIGGVTIQLVNQKGVNITDAVVNITAKGGLLGKINTTVDETLNITIDKPAELIAKSKLLGLGSIKIAVKVTMGAEVIESEISALQIGPIIIA